MEDINSEIDLWELIGNGFNLLKKRKTVILSFFLLGILFGFSNLLMHPLDFKAFFRKEFIAQSSVISNEILCDIINNIPLNPKEKSTNTNGVLFPNSRNIQGKLAANNNKETRLRVTIEVFSSADIDSVLNLLTVYINSIEALNEKFKFQQQQQRQLLSVLKKQIALSDTAGKNANSLNSVEVFEKKQNLEKELLLNKIVNFIPINPDCIFISNRRAGVLNVLGYSFLGIVIGFIIAFAMNLVQRK
ncbi:MAG: hypothetical protein HY841_12125 [Bacteroidetes bacterium]|nr:hypothetical protein [Bacteroidota bacterium]